MKGTVGSVGTILATGGGVYRVALDGGARVDASLRGRLKLEARTGSRVVIGDRVRVDEGSGESCTVEEVLPRATEIVRRAPGRRKAKVVAANVDRLIAVVAAVDPDPHPELVDRLLLTAEGSGIEAVLVINKADLGSWDCAPLYRSIGYRVIETSATTGLGIGDLKGVLCSGTSALVGPSGAGKSSLLNTIEPTLELRIGELSSKAARGRHTTVSSRLIELSCGGRVADTPGFSDVGLWDVDPETLDECFPEFLPYLGECRFRGCAHLREPDCAVKSAVESRKIDPRRYATYQKLRSGIADER